MSTYVSSNGVIGMTITSMSYMEIFKIACIADDSIMKDPRTLIKLIENNLSKCLASPEGPKQ
jgi:hypothetical protein